jgi:hypothetical protein
MHPLNELEVLQQKCKEDEYIYKAYPHVIPQESCRVFLVSGLNYTFKQKSANLNDLLSKSTAILQNISNNVPKGVVVFL